MKAVEQYVVLLATVHVAWLYFYLCGTIVSARRAPEALPPLPAGEALVEIVVRTACGIALTGFVTFLLGLCHLISPLGAALWLAVLVAGFAYRGDPPWKRAFWSARVGVWRSAASPGAGLVYLAALPLGFLAARPDSGSDATVGYMVYATDWARAHALTLDFHVRPTFYADNWILIDTWLVVFRRPDAGAMLTWLVGCLSLLGIYGYVLSVDERRGAPARRSTVAFGLLAAASLALSPVFVRYVGSALVDIPIGFMFFASALSLVRAVRSNGRAGVPELIACAAFFVGTKLSLVVFTPLFALAVAFVVLRARWRPRAIAAAVAVFLALAAPWYVKNFIQAGDPISPVLNLALRDADPKWTSQDLGYVQRDLKSQEGGPVERAMIPLDIVVHPTEYQFREAGTSFMMLLLVLPGAVVAFFLLRRRPGDPGTFAFAALLVFAIGYWISTSYMARYSLEFGAAFTAFAAGVLVLGAQRGFYQRWGLLACAVVLALPSPGAAAFYGNVKSTDDDFYHNYVDHESWMLPRGPVYPEVVYLSGLLHRAHREDLTVYRPNIETDRLYWTERGITAVGDLIGPDRYAGFTRAIYDDMLGDYVKRFNIGAFVIPTANPNMSPGLQRRLDEEARALRFRRVVLPDRPVVMYVSSEVPG
jgi:hypothetical protein